MKQIAVSIVEDNDGLREGLSMLISGSPGFTLVKAYANAEAAMRSIPNHPPDIVLMDINLPEASGIRCTEFLRKACPGVQVLVQTVYEDPETVFEALKAGANGYILKKASSEEILEAIRDIMDGGAPVSSSIARKVVQSFHRSSDDDAALAQNTNREDEVLGLLAKGSKKREIADKLFISPETGRRHVHSIYCKLHVRTRTEAVIKYMENKSGRIADNPADLTGS